MFRMWEVGPRNSTPLSWGISFLYYSDATHLAKSNTALLVMNNIFIIFFFKENFPCVGNI